MLLVGRGQSESAEELFASMQSRYDACLEDTEFGALYRVGATYIYQCQKFSKICTFAGSLVIRIVLDTRQRRFERPVIYRFDTSGPLRLLDPEGQESEIEEHQLRGESSC